MSLPRFAFLASVLIAAGACPSSDPAVAVPPDPDSKTVVSIIRAFPALAFDKPLFLCSAPGLPGQLFVAEQDGRVLEFRKDPEVREVSVALDLRDRVRRKHMEEGLLGLAFHPDYARNRTLYLHYSASEPRRNVLSRFTADEGGRSFLADTESVLLEVEQPFGNHNGGMIAFGPDGFLYLALGDGGSAGDPYGNGQNKATLLGSILRIDVDRADGGRAYAIPADNPFRDEAGARPEIWAYGLRNVWRFSFDRETGELWAGDVGQNAWEEIDLIRKGGNYGWNVREGAHGFQGGAPPGPLIDPVVEHDRRDARSITGGYVYRGQGVPGLRGAYIYGDFATGKVWALRHHVGEAAGLRELGKVPGITSFGEDAEGELYLLAYTGEVYTLR